jgi:hypothetical protein
VSVIKDSLEMIVVLLIVKKVVIMISFKPSIKMQRITLLIPVLNGVKMSVFNKCHKAIVAVRLKQKEEEIHVM